MIKTTCSIYVIVYLVLKVTRRGGGGGGGGGGGAQIKDGEARAAPAHHAPSQCLKVGMSP